MISLIRQITRALRRRGPGIEWDRDHFIQVMTELDRRGGRRHEAGVFLLGTDRRVLDTIYYDDLDPRAYETGVCILHGGSFGKLWAVCRERSMTVIADVHTHGGAARQSSSDKANPMVAQPGHVAFIVPGFAKPPIRRERLGVYEYLGDHRWTDRSGSSSNRFLRMVRNSK